MNVAEIRAAFSERDAWETEAEAFRAKRIVTVQRKQLDINFPADRFTLLHVVPLGRLRDRLDVFKNVDGLPLVQHLAPGYDAFRPTTTEAKGSLHGPICVSGRSGHAAAIVTLFRSGAVELATAEFHSSSDVANGYVVNCLADMVKAYLPAAIKVLGERLGIAPPFVIYLSIIGATDMHALHLGRYGVFKVLPRKFTENEMLFPGVALERQGDARNAAFDLIDMAYQAGGSA